MHYLLRRAPDSETIRYTGQSSPWFLLPEVLLGALLLPLFGAGLALWAVAGARFATTRAIITDERIVAHLGVVRRQTVELSLVQAESIRVDQSWLGRLFDYGSIVISAAGNPQPRIPGIRRPRQFLQRFVEIQERAVDACRQRVVELERQPRSKETPMAEALEAVGQ